MSLVRCQTCNTQMLQEQAAQHACPEPAVTTSSSSAAIYLSFKDGDRKTLTWAEAGRLLTELHELFHGED